VADCLGSDGAVRNYVAQLGVPICRTTACETTLRGLSEED
jgi:hypothetical protein